MEGTAETMALLGNDIVIALDALLNERHCTTGAAFKKDNHS